MSKKKDDKSTQVDLGIKRITVTDYSFKSSPSGDKEKFLKELKFNVRSSLESKVKDNSVIVSINITVVHIEDDKTTEYITLNSKVFFNIIPLKNVTTIKKINGINTSVFVNDNIPYTLLGISYSTVRGILHDRLSSTEYAANIILPVVDPKKLLNTVSD